ncbi:MAG: integrase [Planctomycetes bacterium]|nr:integrase [Planctomycetota bacterium]
MKRNTMVCRVRDYLRLRRSLGFQMRSQEEMLLRFARHLDRSKHRGPLTVQKALEWANRPHLSQSTRATRLSAVRCSARYMAVRDGQTEVPGRHLVPKVCFRQRPHLYSQRELEQLLAATQRLWPSYPLKRLVYWTLFGLLACTGLRVSEALKLNAAHVDVKHDVLRIEETKFKKSRLEPLHATATRAMCRYALARYGQLHVRDNSPFSINDRGIRLTYCAVRWNFERLRDMLGLTKGNGQRPRPRLHDMRHTFACQRLLSWYRQGKDVHHLIAALSTYLGHGKVSDTYWYLTGTPELLAVAGGRFERFASRAQGGRS